MVRHKTGDGIEFLIQKIHVRTVDLRKMAIIYKRGRR